MGIGAQRWRAAVAAGLGAILVASAPLAACVTAEDLGGDGIVVERVQVLGTGDRVLKLYDNTAFRAGDGPTVIETTLKTGWTKVLHRGLFTLSTLSKDGANGGHYVWDQDLETVFPLRLDTVRRLTAAYDSVDQDNAWGAVRVVRIKAASELEIGECRFQAIALVVESKSTKGGSQAFDVAQLYYLTDLGIVIDTDDKPVSRIYRAGETDAGDDT